MKVFIIANDSKQSYIDHTKALIDSLNASNIEWMLSESLSRDIFGNTDAAKDISEADLIITIGGDGTVLKASKLAIKYDLPLLGINAGRLGHLCALGIDEINKLNSEYISNLVKSKRTILECMINDEPVYALNDLVIFKCHLGKTVELDVTFNDEVMYTRGDGLIISTPTGSTSYNYSANGPKVDPNVNALIMTPICPHEGVNYSQVLTDDTTISITIRNPLANDALLICDGDVYLDLYDQLTITKSDKHLTLLTSK